jgi:hypothetical protein
MLMCKADARLATEGAVETFQSANDQTVSHEENPLSPLVAERETFRPWGAVCRKRLSTERGRTDPTVAHGASRPHQYVLQRCRDLAMRTAHLRDARVSDTTAPGAGRCSAGQPGC